MSKILLNNPFHEKKQSLYLLSNNLFTACIVTSVPSSVRIFNRGAFIVITPSSSMLVWLKFNLTRFEHDVRQGKKSLSILVPVKSSVCSSRNAKVEDHTIMNHSFVLDYWGGISGRGGYSIA